MVQNQLVDYITAQLKLGASRETVKGALLGAGWQAADVDDSFKKVDAPTAVAPMSAAPATVAPSVSPASNISAGSASNSNPTKPANTFSGTSSSFFTKQPTPASGSGAGSAPGPQVFRMSDLVSSDSPAAAKATPSAKRDSMQYQPAAAATSPVRAASSPSSSSSSKKGIIFGAIGVIVILALAGLAGYLYMQNNSLSSQVASLTSQSSGVTSQISALTSQVSSLTASSTANAEATAGLASANAELMTELSFYAIPPGSTATTTQLSVTGSLSINAAKMYFITASYGGKIFVANSRDPKVVAVLASLINGSTQLAGTFVPGSDAITVTAINGTLL